MREDSPEQLTIACVVDRLPYEALYLFQSLEYFGGKCAHANRRAYLIKEMPPDISEAFDRLNVRTKFVDPVLKEHPHTNKIRMLNDDYDTDYLIALDTDIVVARDFSSQITGRAIACAPAVSNPLTLEQWKALFAHFGLDLPKTRYLTFGTLDETLPYFNTGVVIVPSKLRKSVYEGWLKFILEMPRAYETFRDIPKRVTAWATDQIAFSLALADVQWPSRALPLEMNFPTKFPVHPSFEPERLNPYLLHHYHTLSKASGVPPCAYANVNALIEQINKPLFPSS
jgi:hypothetical protein